MRADRCDNASRRRERDLQTVGIDGLGELDGAFDRLARFAGEADDERAVHEDAEPTTILHELDGSIDLVGSQGEVFGAEEGTRVLAERPLRADLAPDPQMPADSRLWAALQHVSGGTWGGCVFDVDAILKALGSAG